MEKPIKYILYEPAKTVVTRIIPELAREIGLNQSIVLLQISYWISISDNLEEGRYWTYQSFRDMRRKAFPYWGVGTIHRTIEKLIAKKLITKGEFNKRKSDETQWYSLNIEGCSRLKSVALLSADTAQGVPDWNGVFQNGTGAFQIGTTLPEITTENTQTKEKPAPKGAGAGKSKAPQKRETKGQRVVRLATPYAGYIVGLVKLFRREIDVEFVGWERLNTAMLEEYTEHAESIQGAGLTADDLPGLYAYLQSKGWPSFGPRKMAEYALDYAAVKAKKIIPLNKPTEDTPSFYSAFMEENAS